MEESNGVKFYYERVLGGQRKIYLVERPRKEKTLPEVLSEQEFLAVLNTIDNIKHRAIVLLIYSAGLRLNEVVNLRIKDIDSERTLRHSFATHLLEGGTDLRYIYPVGLKNGCVYC